MGHLLKLYVHIQPRMYAFLTSTNIPFRTTTGANAKFSTWLRRNADYSEPVLADKKRGGAIPTTEKNVVVFKYSCSIQLHLLQEK